MQAKEVKCPGCGAPQAPENTTCKFCKQPVIISSFTSVADMPAPMLNKYVRGYTEALKDDPNQSKVQFSIGMCYLKLKIYDKARESFERAFEENFDDSEAYFYAAVCVLGGKKAFLCMRPQIDKIEEYIGAALSIEPKGIYYYLWAYIRYDYYSRKSFRISPNYIEVLEMAKTARLSPHDIDQLYKVLGVDRPGSL
jgi:tetratricopeptide (TPR) repeat protein